MKKTVLILAIIAGIFRFAPSRAQLMYTINNTNSVFIQNNESPVLVSDISQAQTYITNDLQVYPNPTVSIAAIILPEAFGSAYPVYVNVIDMNGRVDASYQYAPGIYKLDVDMSGLPAGLYSVRVFGSGTNNHNLKVMKN